MVRRISILNDYFVDHILRELSFFLEKQVDKILFKDSPIALPKSIKNSVEIEGMKNANVSISLFS